MLPSLVVFSLATLGHAHLKAIPFLFHLTGFFPTMFLFILFMMRIVLPLPWITALATSVIASVGGYFLFESWLKIQFPRGFLGL